MSVPFSPLDVRVHHRNDSIWQITATVLGVWCAALLVWVVVLQTRKEHR